MRSSFNVICIIGFFIAFLAVIAASSSLGHGEWLGLNCVLAFTGILILRSLRDKRDAKIW